MTLQVAMLGADGWVLASDTMGTLQGGNWIRQTYQAKKILYHNRVASTVYGDESAMIARQRIVDELNPAPNDFASPEFFERITAKAVNIWETEFKTHPISAGRDRGIVFMAAGHKTIWDLTFGKQGVIKFDYSRLVTGDPCNPVIFLSQRYYRQEYTVNQLAFLASHIVVQGRRFNAMIGGLELMTWHEGDAEAQPVDPEPYEKQSATLDQDILDLTVKSMKQL